MQQIAVVVEFLGQYECTTYRNGTSRQKAAPAKRGTVVCSDWTPGRFSADRELITDMETEMIAIDPEPDIQRE
jgi:hypothetical protein